jgi:hypothetical protein
MGEDLAAHPALGHGDIGGSASREHQELTKLVAAQGEDGQDRGEEQDSSQRQAILPPAGPELRDQVVIDDLHDLDQAILKA